MALFNESLEGRFSQLVQRLHSMKGASPVPQVAPEISHAIQLNDELDHLAHLFLARVTRYSTGVVSITGDATHYGAIEFRNPVGSGVIAQVELLRVDVTSNQFVDVKTLGAAVVGSSGSSTPLDLREQSGKKSACTNFTSGATVVGQSGSSVARIFNGVGLQATYTVEEVRGLILPPGTNLVIFTGAVTQTVACHLIHRERAVSPAELLL